MSSPPPTLEEIRVWLLDKLREKLDSDTALDDRRPLADYGLSSLSATDVTAELEDWLNLELDPTIFFDYPSIGELARFLKDELDGTT